MNVPRVTDISGSQWHQIVNGATETAIISTDQQGTSPVGIPAPAGSWAGLRRRCLANLSVAFLVKKNQGLG